MFDRSSMPPLVFFHTVPKPCPYLPDRLERRLIVDISGQRGRSHDQLARAGFRRVETFCYRPACPGCKACVPIRVRTDDFLWTRSFRRVWRRNLDLNETWRPRRVTDEQFALFARYQKTRHGDSQMSQMDYDEFTSMVEQSPIESLLLEYRDPDSGLLVGVMLVDLQSDGFSAVYSFYSEEESERSLGTYMVLDLVTKAACQRLPFVYLGYWITDSRKMSYKSRFRPAEILVDTGWKDLDSHYTLGSA